MKKKIRTRVATPAAVSPAVAGEINAASRAAWWGIRSRVQREMYYPLFANQSANLPLAERISAAAWSAQDAYSPRRVPGSPTMYVLVSDGWESPTHFALCRGKEVIGVFPISSTGFESATRAL